MQIKVFSASSAINILESIDFLIKTKNKFSISDSISYLGADSNNSYTVIIAILDKLDLKESTTLINYLLISLKSSMISLLMS